MMDYVVDWLNLFFRWFHVIAGVAWIGASFYFVWLDNHLETPPDWKKKKGIKGDLWAIHGGGFYEIAKYKLGPEQMPETLHWFKWEAYTTWLTGIVLLTIVYYSNAQSFMVTPNTAITDPSLSVIAGVAIIAMAVICYELLQRTAIVANGLYFAIAMFVLFSVLSWLSFHLLSPRAACIHLGASIGSIMAGNVFWGIMPSQRSFVNAVKNNQPPNEPMLIAARRRSIHNNYFTLPIIFIMISNHYGFIYTHEYSWFWLVCLASIMAYARHFFNLKHRGIVKPSILVIALALAALLAVFIKPSHPTGSSDYAEVSEQQAMTIVSQHCSNCHAIQPSQEGFSAAPLGIILETPQQLTLVAEQASKAVASSIMPLGNMTGMTDDERQQLLTWLKQQQNKQGAN